MTINKTLMKKSHNDQGIQRDRLPVDDAGGYTGNQDLFMAYPMRELLIANDSSSDDLTFTLTDSTAAYTITFTLKPGDISDERYYPFTEVNVVATGAWRYIVRSGSIS